MFVVFGRDKNMCMTMRSPCICILYLHFDVILQLGVQEVQGDRLLEFRILWGGLDFSSWRESIRKTGLMTNRRNDVEESEILTMGDLKTDL